jgi:hypothetical protein
MSSSIFDFEVPARLASPASGDDPASWRHVSIIAVFGTAILFAAAVLLLALADPYDTGRYSLMPEIGVADGNPRTANASRGRDQQFNAAIIGNSRGQLIDPRRLSAASSANFVQLTVPGTGPREQLTLMRWFTRHHARIGAIVLAADQSWCTPDPALPIISDFPFWLYADSDIDYLKGLPSATAFGRLVRRVRLAMGRIPRSDPAGYWDYTKDLGPARDPAKLAKPLVTMNDGIPVSAPLPAVGRLREFLKDLPPDVPFVVLLPPAYQTALPAPGSVGAMRLARCKQALAELVASRPRGAFLDFFLDGPVARDANNFFDHIHYGEAVARMIEDGIAGAVK